MRTRAIPSAPEVWARCRSCRQWRRSPTPSPTRSAFACATCRCRRRGCAPRSTRRSCRARRISAMPRVVISGQAARRFTGGQTEFEVEANNFRRMVLELDRRYPGLGRQIEESMAVAIDGEIFQDAYLAPLNPESEIYLIPKIGGG